MLRVTAHRFDLARADGRRGKSALAPSSTSLTPLLSRTPTTPALKQNLAESSSLRTAVSIVGSGLSTDLASSEW